MAVIDTPVYVYRNRDGLRYYRGETTPLLDRPGRLSIRSLRSIVYRGAA